MTKNLKTASEIMRYLIRSVKYFIYMALLLALMLFVLSQMNMVNGDVGTMFVNGYDSLWQIALILAAFSALYPRLSYGRRSVRALGSYEEIRPAVLQVMDEHDYRLESEDGENLTFIKRSPISRALKMWEDRITFTRTIDGFEAEGRIKDIVRVASTITYKTGSGE